tara:strand:- start:1247 stop:1414 length:168 start_codon:yes stop_codon:yes gene_type:complete
MKKFKPHMMYDKSGKGHKANTYEDHLAMKKKGFGHTKPEGAKKRAARFLKKKDSY